MHRFLVSKTTLSTSVEDRIKHTSSTQQPSKFCSWNCNGFSVRLNTENKHNLDEFVSFIQKEQPDVLTLQEVRMTRASEGQSGSIDHSKKSPKCLRSDADLFAIFKRRIPEYTVHLSLAGKKYAGQAILVRKTLQIPTISYTFEKTGCKRQHDNEGRIIIAEFEHVILLSTYTPNNGVTEDKFQRRRDWDGQLEKFLIAQRETGKAIVYQVRTCCSCVNKYSIKESSQFNYSY
jgi:AP endonuclease 1